MFDKLTALRTWVLAKPIREAVASFFLVVLPYCTLRLILVTNRFLADPEGEILFAIVFGLLFAITVYAMALQQLKK